ncbi:MAG: acyl-ACP--UDP-N-acetylglucosamine O-acyltransferase [Candidatus Sumerlaeaceae bacterium]
MPQIHPTAIIDRSAEIDSSAEIGPHVIIDGPVRIGARTRILANAHLSGRTIIGEDNEIHMGAIIGHAPQHLAYKGGDSGVRIGNHNVIREYVTIHRAYHPGQETVLGDNNFLMALSHVAHDATVQNNVIMANGSLLAGHTHVEDSANISGNVAVHQYVRIGRLAMIGGLSKVIKDVPPFMMVDGISLIHGLNTVGLRRAGYDLLTRKQIKEAYRILYRSGLNVPQAVERLETEYPGVAPVQELVDFIRKSVRGISRHAPIHESVQEAAVTED